ncbi:MAG TPA: glycosyltransferase family 39 protein [Roseiflexaceae bacterium]
MVAAFLALAVLYSTAVPLGEGPDEPGHAAYAFFLARAGRLPVQRADPLQSDVPGEGHQPPLAYALAAPLALWLPPQERRLDLIGNPRFTWVGGAEVNVVAHGSREYLPWGGTELAWHLMRLASVALGAVTVLFTYLAARTIDYRLQIADCRLGSTQSAIPLLAAGLVAFNPQFLFVSALVTNDALLAALSAGLLWLVIRTDGRRPSWEAIAIGMVLGLALLTKQSAMILIPIAMLGVIRRDGREAGERREHKALVRFTTPLLLRSLAPSLIVLMTAALVAGWWYTRNWWLYGDLLGLAAFRGEFATQPFQIGSLAAWIAALAQLHASFWARFGWMNVAPPAWALWLIGTIELIGLAGLIRVALATRRDSERRSVAGYWPLVALLTLAFAWIISFALTTGLVAWQGRLLFPALPAIAILLAKGIENAKLKMQNVLSHVSHFTIYILHLALIAIAIWLPYGVIRPAYPPQTLPETVAQSRIGTQAQARFRRSGERSVALRGWRLDGPARPGATLNVALIWYASARQGHDWVVFVHLVDTQDRIVAEDNRPPRDGAFPMTQWAMGDWIEDPHSLRLPAGLADGVYTLRVGLYDPKRNNERAGVYGDRSKLLGDSLDLGRIMVAGDN